MIHQISDYVKYLDEGIYKMYYWNMERKSPFMRKLYEKWSSNQPWNKRDAIYYAEYLGFESSTVNHWISGRNNPSAPTAVLIGNTIPIYKQSTVSQISHFGIS